MSAPLVFDRSAVRHRPGVAEDRRFRDGGRGQKRHAEIDREGSPEPFAERPFDETDA